MYHENFSQHQNHCPREGNFLLHNSRVVLQSYGLEVIMKETPPTPKYLLPQDIFVKLPNYYKILLWKYTRFKLDEKQNRGEGRGSVLATMNR